jgi:hypothetical protein
MDNGPRLSDSRAEQLAYELASITLLLTQLPAQSSALIPENPQSDEMPVPFASSTAATMHVMNGILSGKHQIPIGKWVESVLNTNPGRATGKPTNVEQSIDNTDDLDRLTLKRLRNRVSASRCRQKKKIWVHLLETSVKQLEDLGARTEKYVQELEAERSRLLNNNQ